MMGRASREKGKRGEREARDMARTYWHSGDRCIRAAQANGSFSADILNALPRCHVEVKRYARIKAVDFYRQAQTESQDHEIPVVMMREDNGPWLVMFAVQHTQEFVDAFIDNLRDFGGLPVPETHAMP